ncbi:MAG TPA: SOS response-associated peptidase [Jiangellales bacterium]|nr:SOS response-associated peptidase [Jiangellales bacterium]
MCGRYASSRSPEDLAEEFEVDRVDVRERLEPDWNVAPTKPVPAVFERRDRATGAVARRLAVVRWGLVPSWAKDVRIGSRLINARVETVHEKPAFRRAFAARRCLLPADGYYEWYGEVRGRKQPFFIRPRDGGVLAMAGLYEIWRDPAVPDDDDPAAFVWSSTVLTTTAEDALGHLHDRMPMTVERDHWAQWLDPAAGANPDALRGLLVPAAPGRLEAFPVATLVNDVRVNGPELVEPLPAEPEGDARPDSGSDAVPGSGSAKDLLF